MPGGDHLRGSPGLHLAAVAASVRASLPHRLPALRPVEPGPGVGQAPPGRPRHTRCAGRAGLVAVRDRFGQRPGGKREPLTRPNPTDRGKSGSKIHLATDRNGVPLSLGISGANMHDSLGLQPLVRGIPPVRSRRGPSRRRPAKLHADKGYDYDHLREWLRERRIRHRIARKGIVLHPAPDTAGSSNGRCPGWPAAPACTAATNCGRPSAPQLCCNKSNSRGKSLMLFAFSVCLSR
jgi:transposase